MRIVRDPSPEARGAFDAGVRELNEDTSESLRRAQAHFRDAVEVDREYTDAWAGVALASWLLGIDARDAELADDEAERWPSAS